MKFNIAVPKEFILNMIIFPEMFLRKINEKKCRWGTLADRLIEWCDKYEVDIAKEMAELVLDQLNTVCRNTDNRKVKGYCNNMILDIEKQYYEQLDIPWENGEIMKFAG